MYEYSVVVASERGEESSEELRITNEPVLCTR